MKFIKTEFDGLFVIELDKIIDERGYFARIWCKKEFATQGLNGNFVQANTSFCMKKGIIRGIHYQKDQYQEDKLLECVNGSVYDIGIDLRKNSKTYGKYFGIEISSKNQKMVYVPKGFAHGYQALNDGAIVIYQTTTMYTPGAEGGIRYNDPLFNIQWPIDKCIVSKKDESWADYKMEK